MEINTSIDKFFKNQKKLFWFFHILFWLAHWIISVISFPKEYVSLEAVLSITSSYVFSFSLCLVLRVIYKRYNWVRFPLLKLIIVTVIAAVFSGIAWNQLDKIYTFCWYGFKIPLSEFYVKKSFLNQAIDVWYKTYSIVTWSALYFGYKLWMEWNEQKVRTAEEHAQMKSAQFEMLRYQLNPHFLFNTLSSIEGLIEIDPQKAKAMIVQISEFLRYSLFEGERSFIPLSKEINIIKVYLGIEKIRFRDNLIIEYRIDPNAVNYPIPVFLIHPLIENAIKHGMKSSPMPLTIAVAARRTDDNGLQIDVTNSGRWSAESTNGIGLQNIRRRLEHAYPNNHDFEVIKEENSVHVRIMVKKV
jgi:hypothetical protein